MVVTATTPSMSVLVVTFWWAVPRTDGISRIYYVSDKGIDSSSGAIGMPLARALPLQLSPVALPVIPPSVSFLTVSLGEAMSPKVWPSLILC